jgi:hypothetical protein
MGDLTSDHAELSLSAEEVELLQLPSTGRRPTAIT